VRKPEKMIKWAQGDLLAGRITQAQHDAMLAELGTTPEQQPGADTRPPEILELDSQFPPAKPSEYVIQYGLGELNGPQKEFDTTARNWLAGAEFPKALGDSLVTNVGRVAEHTRNMDDAQLENYGADEFQKLRGVYGEKLEEKLTMAGRMIKEIEGKHPGLQQLLKGRGIGDNAVVASLLIQQAQRYFARRGQQG
jgi:hypothetical protein